MAIHKLDLCTVSENGARNMGHTNEVITIVHRGVLINIVSDQETRITRVTVDQSTTCNDGHPDQVAMVKVPFRTDE